MEQQRVWPLRGRSRCMSASIDLGRLLSWQQRDEAPPDLQPGCSAGKCLRLRLCLTILRPLRIETLFRVRPDKGWVTADVRRRNDLY